MARRGEPQSLPERVVTGLARVGTALGGHVWQGNPPRALSPTQGQILSLLRGRPAGVRLNELAGELAVTPATVSDSVASLLERRLVRKRTDAGDRRGVIIRLTAAGRREADRSEASHDLLARATDQLTESEQEVLLLALVKIIRSLQEDGAIPPAQMCVTCRYFRPFAHDDSHQPHHCEFVDAAFGNRALRVACGEHEAAEPEAAKLAWLGFSKPS